MNVTLYLPSGMVRTKHTEALAIILKETKATKVRRWTDETFQYEDYQDPAGNVVAQIETTGYPLADSRFELISGPPWGGERGDVR